MYSETDLLRGRFSAVLNVLRLEESLYRPEEIWPEYEARRGEFGGELKVVTIAGTIHKVNGKRLNLGAERVFPDTLFVELEALASQVEPARLRGVNGGISYRSATIVIPAMLGPTLLRPKYGGGGQGSRVKVRFTAAKPILTETGNVYRGLNGRGDPVYYLEGYSLYEEVAPLQLIK